MALAIKEENWDINEIDKLWLLVEWIGSYPEDSLDIINGSDIVLENQNDINNLKVGNTVMVLCGRLKAVANILLISENSDALYKKLRKLQKEQERSNKSITPPPVKKQRPEETLTENRLVDKPVQTDDTGRNINEILLENQKLKTELYESKQIINTMCKELQMIIQKTQKKINKQGSDNNCDEEDSQLSDKENVLSESNINSCSTIELKDKILIGHGKTPIPKHIYNQINWLSVTAATRKLLMATFSRKMLATHSLTGKPSPAFAFSDLPRKMKLNPKKVADIVQIVSEKCNVTESMVRNAITTKCADENKMFKRRQQQNETK